MAPATFTTNIVLTTPSDHLEAGLGTFGVGAKLTRLEVRGIIGFFDGNFSLAGGFTNYIAHGICVVPTGTSPTYPGVVSNMDGNGYLSGGHQWRGSPAVATPHAQASDFSAGAPLDFTWVGQYLITAPSGAWWMMQNTVTGTGLWTVQGTARLWFNL